MITIHLNINSSSFLGIRKETKWIVTMLLLLFIVSQNFRA